MRSLACWLTILVACNRPTGIEIVVRSAPSAVKVVRVFLGTGTVSSPLSSSTTLTVPSPASPAAQGSAKTSTTTQNIFVRDADNDDWLPYTPGASFQFSPRGSDDTIYAAIVVGYTGSAADDVPIGAQVVFPGAFDAHKVAVYDVDLGSDVPFLWSTVADAPNTTLFDAECAGFSGAAGSAFVVMDPDDEDCDGFHDGSNIECSPFNFDDQNGVASVENGTCFSQSIGSASDPQCRLGGLACVDGSGVDPHGKCAPTDTCLAHAACECPVSDSTHALGCLVGPTTPAATAGFTCNLGNGIDSNCEVQLPPVPTGGMPCDGSAGGLAVDGGGEFATPLMANGYRYQLMPDPSCAASIRIDPSGNGSNGGSGSGSGSGNAGQVLLMKLVLVNGASVVVPIALAFGPGGGTCSTTLPGACQGPAFNQGTGFTDPAFTQCMAGWGSSSSTTLVGTSPTLTADASTLYYIGSDSKVYEGGSDANGTWTSTPAAGFMLADDSVPVALHLTSDNKTMYVVDALSSVTGFQYDNTLMAWTPATTPFTLGSGDSLANSFSPNTDLTDAIFGTTKAELYEVTGMPPYVLPATGLEAGQTPYMTEDSVALWSVDTGTAGLSIYVQQRSVGIGDGNFTDKVELTELRSSMTAPQAPWLQPIVAAPTPGQQRMFYAADNGTNGNPMIYWVQRAPLLVP
jgi:hypothetical protein